MLSHYIFSGYLKRQMKKQKSYFLQDLAMDKRCIEMEVMQPLYMEMNVKF